MKKTAKILLVDDEPGMLRYIKTLLEVDDYKVETATTGEEALEKIEKGLRSRSRFARCPDARHRRLADARANSPETARRQGRDAFLRQRHSQGRARHETGRAGLFDQALSES